uniref:Uncharacterized protein n=1 Tax=Parascaris univalens TaxID=6257 RepID=A0A915C5P4_PARUN
NKREMYSKQISVNWQLSQFRFFSLLSELSVSQCKLGNMSLMLHSSNKPIIIKCTVAITERNQLVVDGGFSDNVSDLRLSTVFSVEKCAKSNFSPTVVSRLFPLKRVSFKITVF